MKAAPTHKNIKTPIAIDLRQGMMQLIAIVYQWEIIGLWIRGSEIQVSGFSPVRLPQVAQLIFAPAGSERPHFAFRENEHPEA